MTAGRPARPIGTYLKLAVTALLWSGTTIAGRFSAEALSPLASSWVRYLAAVLLLVPLLAQREGFVPLDRRQAAWVFALGAAGVVSFNLFFFLALARIPASRGAVIMALNPAFMVLALALFWRERPKPLRIAGVFLALAGAWTVLTGGDLTRVVAGITSGDLFMLGACISWTVYGLIARFAIRGLTVLAATTYASVFGWLALSILAAPDLLRTDWAAVAPAALAAMAYMGLLGTALAFIWYSEGLMRIGPARATVFMNLVPVFSIGLAAALLGESIAASMIIGGLVTIVGIALTNRG